MLSGRCVHTALALPRTSQVLPMCFRTTLLPRTSQSLPMVRVGQNPLYTVHIQYFSQELHQMYGHIQHIPIYGHIQHIGMVIDYILHQIYGHIRFWPTLPKVHSVCKVLPVAKQLQCSLLFQTSQLLPTVYKRVRSASSGKEAAVQPVVLDK